MATITTYKNGEIPDHLKPSILEHVRVVIQTKGDNLPDLRGKKCLPMGEILKSVNGFLQDRGVNVTRRALNGLLHNNRVQISRSAAGKPIWCVTTAGVGAAAPASSSTLKKRAPLAPAARRPAAKKLTVTLADWSPQDYTKLREEGLSRTEGDFINFLKKGLGNSSLWKFAMEDIPASGPSPPIANPKERKRFPIHSDRVFVLLASEDQKSVDGFRGKGYWIMAGGKRVGVIVSICGRWNYDEWDHIACFGVAREYIAEGHEYGVQALNQYLKTKRRAATVTTVTDDERLFKDVGFASHFDWGFQERRVLWYYDESGKALSILRWQYEPTSLSEL